MPWSFIEPHFCILCHRPCLKQDLCQRCSHKLPWVTHLPTLKTTAINPIQSLFAHETPVDDWIYQFKYRRQLRLCTLFATLMTKHLYLSTPIDVIIPIPLHPSRLKQRGYNQVDLLVKALYKQLSIHYDTEFIFRKKMTQSQIGLKFHQRQKNVKNCFQLNPKKRENPYTHILIVDDVYTTGATLNEAANTIKKSFPNIKINAWTLTRAL